MAAPGPATIVRLSVARLTPGRVRRARGGLLAQWGTPARPPKPRGKAAGRARARVREPGRRSTVDHPNRPPTSTPPTLSPTSRSGLLAAPARFVQTRATNSQDVVIRAATATRSDRWEPLRTMATALGAAPTTSADWDGCVGRLRRRRGPGRPRRGGRSRRARHGTGSC